MSRSGHYPARKAAGLDPIDALRFEEGQRGLELVGAIPRLHKGMLDILRLDLRYALRSFQHTPLFAAGVAVTIGLGLGFTSSAFTVVNAYILKPLDIRDPHQIYALSWDSESERRHAFSVDDLSALGRGNDVFEDVLAFGNVQIAQDDVSLYGQLVTGNYFAALGVRSFVGRLIEDADAARPGERPVVVLSHDAWAARYGADLSIVGRDVRLGRSQYTVVGVAQPGFGGFGDAPISFWVPVTMAGQLPVRDLYGVDRPATLTALARTRPTVRPSEAAAWFDVWVKQRFANAPADQRPIATSFESRATRIPLNGRTLTMFSTIEAAFAMVLLIACANVANLMLARGIGRQREIAVRLSLGASRSRIVHQLFIESVLLAVPAAGLGYLLTLVAARIIPAVVVRTWPEALPPVSGLLAPMEPDLRVVIFLMAGALAAATLFGLVPALHTSRTSLSRASRGEFGASVRASRVRSALVVSQIAASALFLVMAVGVVAELRRLSTVDTGLVIDAVADVRVPSEYRRAMVERLSADPRIERVAAAWRPPLYGPLWSLLVSPAGQSETVPVGLIVASPEYFDLFGIPLVAGRIFTREESEAGDEVAIVSAATARRFWPTTDAIGEVLDISDANRRRSGVQRVAQRRARVIGVARDVTSGSLVEGRDITCVYLPTSPNSPGSMALLVRARGDMAGLRAALKSATASIRDDATFPIYPMRDVVGLQMWVLGAFSATAGLLAAIALLLAVSGTYAVIAYIVMQRTREFGVRIALGATAGAIVRSVVMQAARLGAMGVAIGATLALGLSQVLASAIEILPTFGASPYALGAAVILTATLGAASLPSLRASRVNPSNALRSE